MAGTFRTAVSLLLLALLCRITAAQTAVVRDNAEMHGTNILLSDLLDTSDPKLATLAGAIALGRSPQPGFERTLLREQIVDRLGSEPYLVGLRIPERIIIRNPGWAISRKAAWSAVLQYLHERGCSDEQLPHVSAVHWPGTIHALQADAPLQITRGEWNASQHVLQVHARCTSARVCGSFLIEVPLTGPPPQLRRSSAKPVKEMSGTHQGAPVERTHLLVTAGRRAILILETAGMRITLPVIPLQRGVLGQQVRVREWNGQRIYHAEVIGQGALRARL